MCTMCDVEFNETYLPFSDACGLNELIRSEFGLLRTNRSIYNLFGWLLYNLFTRKMETQNFVIFLCVT